MTSDEAQSLSCCRDDAFERAKRSAATTYIDGPRREILLDRRSDALVDRRNDLTAVAPIDLARAPARMNFVVGVSFAHLVAVVFFRIVARSNHEAGGEILQQNGKRHERRRDDLRATLRVTSFFVRANRSKRRTDALA